MTNASLLSDIVISYHHMRWDVCLGMACINSSDLCAATGRRTRESATIFFVISNISNATVSAVTAFVTAAI